VFVGVLEGAFAICFHIALGVMVTRAVAARDVLHIAFNAIAVTAQRLGGVFAAEAVIGVGGVTTLL
jgi:hypothetical protein